jgi:hypothetical protein
MIACLPAAERMTACSPQGASTGYGTKPPTAGWTPLASFSPPVGLLVSGLMVRCMHSGRPFCCGCPGLDALDPPLPTAGPSAAICQSNTIGFRLPGVDVGLDTGTSANDQDYQVPNISETSAIPGRSFPPCRGAA